MIQRFIQYFFIALLFAGLLSLERVVGLPLWFCLVWGAWVEHRTRETQVIWTAGFGLLLSSLFLLPFGVGMIFLAILVSWLHLSKRVIKQELVRIMLGSELIVLLLAFATQITWTPERVIAHFLKFLITGLVVWAVVARTTQRQGLGLSLHVQKK